MKQIDDKTCEVFAFELSPLPDCAGTSEGDGEREGEGEREREREGEGEVGQEAAVLSRKHGKESDSENEGLPTKMFKGEDSSSRDGNTSPAPVITTPINPTDSSQTEGTNPVNSQSFLTPRAVVMEWHSCAICLEEMVDTELVTHSSCGAILCPSCLQSSVDHYQKDDLVPCPVCW